MTTIDPRFVAALDLQQYLVDKDSGEPLAAGYIHFFEDDSRTVRKPVYQLTGTFPNYTFTELPNPLRTSGVGTPIDGSDNDIIPYYFPFGGTPDDSTGQVERYFVRVTSRTAVEQFTREAWPPNVSASENSTQDLLNYIPNGQYITYTTPPGSSADEFTPGNISQPFTYIAQGGMFFQRPSGIPDEDNVQFYSFGSDVAAPSGSPQNYVRAKCTDPSGSASFKYLGTIFESVNIFSSASISNTTLTFSVSSRNNLGTTLNLPLYFIRNYGNGGSTTDTVQIGTISLTGAFPTTPPSFSFVCPSNIGKTIGPGNYCAIAIGLPSTTAFDVSATDWILSPGTLTFTAFPTQTQADSATRSISGWVQSSQGNITDGDGSTLYLTPRLTQQGMIWDDSEIGSVLTFFHEPDTTTTNLMLMDDSTIKVSDYSALGIPYSRVFSKLLFTPIGMGIFGTGPDFVTAYGVNDPFGTTATSIRLTTNKLGAATAPSNGATSPAFTYNLITAGTAGYLMKAYCLSSNIMLVQGQTTGAVTAAAAGTSGFTVTEIYNSAQQRQSFTVQTVAGSALANPGSAGKYFSFSSTAQAYYMWFFFTNETDPAPGGTGIKVNLRTAYLDSEVMGCIMSAMNGQQQSEIVMGAASTVAAGSYFSFGVNPTQQYVVWYKKDGAGTAPSVPGAIMIEVNIAGIDTVQTVTRNTRYAINQTYFCNGSAEGLWMRGYDPSQKWDVEVGGAHQRFSSVFGLFGVQPATIELYENAQHRHAIDPVPTPIIGSLPGGSSYSGGNEHPAVNIPFVEYDGGFEARTVNISVYHALRY